METSVTSEGGPEEGLEASSLVDRLLARLAPYEFRTLVLGFWRPAAYDRTEHEALHRPLKIRLGDEIVRRREGVEIDFLRPEIRVEIDPRGEISIRPSPIFVAGRYRKHSRSIPASRWIHHACKGRGCPACSHSGTLCGPSIEELLAEPILEQSGGTRVLFHSLGREDTDARMLGAGRPFVVEVRDPVRRTLSLDGLRERFARDADGAAEVLGLALVDRSAVSAVKGAAAEKTYRAWVGATGRLPEDAAARVAGLTGAVVEQLSPRRVMHRRGRGTCRRRRIVASSWGGELEGRYLWEVRVESGAYVKELVSGDEGRTRPSLSEVLEVPCRCEALDVLEVHWDAPWEGAES